MAAKKENFEQSLKRLERIVAGLEEGELPLEKGLELYKEGLTLAADCRKRLDAARMEIGKITKNGLEAFDVETGALDGDDGESGERDD